MPGALQGFVDCLNLLQAVATCGIREEQNIGIHTTLHSLRTDSKGGISNENSSPALGNTRSITKMSKSSSVCAIAYRTMRPIFPEVQVKWAPVRILVAG